jgi:hypothetical protein
MDSELAFAARKFILVFAFVAPAPMFAVASDEIDAMVPVQQLVDGFNKGDLKLAIAACADEASVIDDFSPHVWKSCEDWARSFEGIAKKRAFPKPRCTWKSLGMLRSLATAPTLSLQSRSSIR